MPQLDPHFARIARRLTTLQLSQPDGAEELGRHFVQTYTASGLHTVIKEYGLDDKLRAQGLGDYELKISDEDPFRHRLEIVLHDGRRVMDMRLHLSTVALPGVKESADVVIVEWLSMQNPRRAFTTERPRLPGQQFPGTGLGNAVAQLLIILCGRIGREGLVIVPERFHLAELYAKNGWLAPSPAADRDLQDVVAATSDLTFAARAWAVERGFIFDDAEQRWQYTPHERVLPVSDRLRHALAPGGFLWLTRLLEEGRSFDVDVEGLRRSLTEDPVEGMDPAHLRR